MCIWPFLYEKYLSSVDAIRCCWVGKEFFFPKRRKSFYRFQWLLPQLGLAIVWIADHDRLLYFDAKFHYYSATSLE